MLFWCLVLIGIETTLAQQLATGGYGGCVLAESATNNATNVRCWVCPEPTKQKLTLCVWKGIFLLQLNQQWNPNPPLELPASRYLAMTQNAACAIDLVGKITCWGDPSEGIFNLPSNVIFSHISIGNWNCGVRLDNQKIQCWGNNYNPILIPNGNYTQLSTHGYQTCALSTGGTVICFGAAPVSIPVVDNHDIIQVTAGTTHVCCLYFNHFAKCFGSNNFGESDPPNGNQFLQLAAGDKFTCGIRLDQTVVCFGLTTSGQSSAPSGTFLQISASVAMACGIRNTIYQPVVCWGSNTYGEQRVLPIEATTIAVASSHLCLLPYDQTLLCYGDNAMGQLNIPYSGKTVSVAVGNQLTCSISALDQKTYCFGDNSQSQLSNMPTNEVFSSIHGYSNAFTLCGIRLTNQTIVCWGLCTFGRCLPPSLLKTNTSLAVGGGGSCAISIVDHSAVCWGFGAMTVPPASTFFIQVGCGNQHCCGVTTNDGVIVCWGSNTLGQLNVPVASGPFVGLSVGFNFNCAITRLDRSIVCWGFAGNPANLPLVIGNFYGSVYAGSNVACSLSLGNQTMSCWGDTTYNLLSVPHVSAANLALATPGTFRLGYLQKTCANGRYSMQRGSLTQGCSGLCDGGYFGNVSLVSTSHCSGICLSGTYCPVGSIAPILCPPGRFGAASALTSSDCSGPCPVGFYCELGTAAAAETPCPAGRYGASVGMTNQNCTETCEAGYFCPTASYSPQSVPCGSAGVYCPAGSGIPLPVSSGYYSSGGVSHLLHTTQSPCLSGYYCVAGEKYICGHPGVYCPPESQQPSLVPAGYYTIGGNTSFTIYPCEQGHYCVNGIKTVCGDSNVYCPAISSQPKLVSVGFFSVGVTDETATFQSICSFGHYCVAGKQYICSAGTYQSFVGQIQCLACQPGFFQDQLGKSTCHKCGFGAYQQLTGQASCNLCPDTGFTINDVSTTCVFCEAGQSINTTTLPYICQPCASGSYTDNSTCVSCETGTFSAAQGSSSCTRCPDGTFSPAPGKTTCFTCAGIRGVTCRDGLLSNNEDIWVQINTDNGQVVSMDCPSGYCNPHLQCGNNRKEFKDNILCGQCLEGYTEWNGSCVYCEKPSSGFILLIFIASWLYVLFSHYISNNTRNTRSGATTTFFYFVQICYMQTGPISGWLSWVSFFNFAPHNTSGSTCVLPLSPYESFGITALIPLAFFGLLALTSCIHYALVRCAPTLYTKLNWREKLCTPIKFMTDPRTKQFVFPWIHYGRTTLILFLWCFTQVATTVIQFLQCVEVPNTKYSVVASSPGIDCYSPEYKKWQVVALLLFIIIVVVIPILISLKLWQNKFAAKTHRMKRDRSQSEKDFIALWGVLFEPFHGQFWFWEILVILGRRIVMAAVNTALSLEPLYKPLIFTWLHIATCIIQLKWRPFRERFDNQLEQVSIFILILLSSFLIVAKPPYAVGDQVMITLLFPLPSLFFLGAIFSRRIQLVYDQHFPPPKVGDLAGDLPATPSLRSQRRISMDSPRIPSLVLASTNPVTTNPVTTNPVANPVITDSPRPTEPEPPTDPGFDRSVQSINPSHPAIPPLALEMVRPAIRIIPPLALGSVCSDNHLTVPPLDSNRSESLTPRRDSLHVELTPRRDSLHVELTPRRDSSQPELTPPIESQPPNTPNLLPIPNTRPDSIPISSSQTTIPSFAPIPTIPPIDLTHSHSDPAIPPLPLELNRPYTTLRIPHISLEPKPSSLQPKQPSDLS